MEIGSSQCGSYIICGEIVTITIIHTLIEITNPIFQKSTVRVTHMLWSVSLCSAQVSLLTFSDTLSFTLNHAYIFRSHCVCTAI